MNPEKYSLRWLIGVGLYTFCAATSGEIARFQLEPEIIGDAYDLDSGEWRYREVHWPEYQAESGDWIRRIDYESADGRVFADKTLNLGSGRESLRIRPEVKQVNRETGRYLNVIKHLEGNTARAQVEVRAVESARPLIGQLPLTDRSVIDAGFDVWIRKNWSAIQRGESVSFDFLAVSRLRWVELLARKRDCETLKHAAQPVEPDLPQTCIQVVTKNPLLRWLVEGIELVYQGAGVENARLMNFSGLGNLVDVTGQGMRVKIIYRYLSDMDLQSPLGS